jgi:chromosomal replication initiation ATPase DnaA
MTEELQAKWEIVRERLHELRGDREYRTAILPLQLLGVEDGTVKMYAPTHFLYGWVKSYYADSGLLQRLWHEVDSQIKQVRLVKYQTNFKVIDGKLTKLMS